MVQLVRSAKFQDLRVTEFFEPASHNHKNTEAVPAPEFYIRVALFLENLETKRNQPANKLIEW